MFGALKLTVPILKHSLEQMTHAIYQFKMARCQFREFYYSYHLCIINKISKDKICHNFLHGLVIFKNKLLSAVVVRFFCF